MFTTVQGERVSLIKAERVTSVYVHQYKYPESVLCNVNLTDKPVSSLLGPVACTAVFLTRLTVPESGLEGCLSG